MLMLALGGCAHQINIVPDTLVLDVQTKYPATIGYVIPDERMNLQVTTPAGGGDKVSYYPYKALDTSLQMAFRQVFQHAQRLQSPQQAQQLEDVLLVFDPTIGTDSSSSSSFFWPPESFTVTLEVKVSDRMLNREYQVKGTGIGKVTRAEWSSDFGVAGKIAMAASIRDLFNNLDHRSLAKDAKLPAEDPKPAERLPGPPAVVVERSDVDALPQSRRRKNDRSFAIVVGIERYRQNLPKADFATNDATLVAAYLTGVMGYPEENVVTLTNDRAGLADFVKYFEKWLPNNIESGSTIFIYYSGHGAPNAKTGDAYLVPYDGDPTFIEETGYPLKRMYAALGKLPAKEVIVALDSCFSGAGGRSVLARGARPIVLSVENPMLASKNITVLSASAGDQVSATYDEKGHGLFTYFLLKGIKNEDVVRQDGSLDVSALYDYLKPQVTGVARKKYNNEQTPQLIGAKNK